MESKDTPKSRFLKGSPIGIVGDVLDVVWVEGRNTDLLLGSLLGTKEFKESFSLIGISNSDASNIEEEIGGEVLSREEVVTEDVGCRKTLLLRKGETLIYVKENKTLSSEWRCKLSIAVFTKKFGESQVWREKLKDLLKCTSEDMVGKVRISFLYYDIAKEACSIVRRIEEVKWEDISLNYPEKTKRGLLDILGIDFSSVIGRILIFYGPPGTGKTYFIRSLLSEFKHVFDFYYILDPHVFFGNPSYIFQFLDEEFYDVDRRKRKLFIFEDMDDVLTLDAKTKMGEGFSKLLNISDGLLGQGGGVFFLFTTNESVGKIHPAVSRFGRCCASQEFLKFNSEEGDRWLESKKYTGKTKKEARSLSSLYGLLSGKGDIMEETDRLGLRK